MLAGLALILTAYCITEGVGVAYTKKETAALAKFRTEVQSELVKDYQKRDEYLLRYLRTHDFNYDKAVRSLEKVHDWREREEIDNILDIDYTSTSKELPYKIEGYDRKGNPLLRLYFGKWLIRKYSITGKREQIVKVFRQMHEKMFQKIWETRAKTGQDIDQFYFLVELAGFNARDQLCIACVPIILQFAGGFDTGSSIFVRNTTLINTPRIFLPALGLVKQLWTGSTLLKSFGIYDSDKDVWQPALHLDVAPDQLPRSMGGSKPNDKI